jgi:hypothetical protein
MRSFHRYAVGSADVQREIVDAVHDAGEQLRLSDSAKAIRVGEILGRMRNAARGRIALGDKDLVPVRTHPELWELRWSLGKLGKFRMYHAEPGSDPDLVALRFHRKNDSSNDAVEIHRLQQEEIDEAAKRYGDGVKIRWGHVVTVCRACVADIESTL